MKADGAVGTSYDVGLPVKERTFGAGRDVDLDIAFLQDFVEAAIARAPQEVLDGVVDVSSVPSTSGRGPVLRHQCRGIPDLADHFVLFVHQVEDRCRKYPRS
jgi:hypothetical protein